MEKLLGFDKKSGCVLSICKWIYTLFFVIIGWVVFRSDSIASAFEYLKLMFGLSENTLYDGLFTGYFTQNVLLLCVGVFVCTPVLKRFKDKAKKNIVTDLIYIAVMILLFTICISSLVSSSYNPFIYFNF